MAMALQLPFPSIRPAPMIRTARSPAAAARLGARAHGRGRGLSSTARFAAAMCGLISARSFAVTKGATSSADARTSQKAEGREIQIAAEKSKEVQMAGKVEQMDALMRKEAVEILAAGAEKCEPVPKEPDYWHAYMKPTTMGTWKNQARLKCKLSLAKTGAVDVEVVEIEVGSWDKDLNAFKFEKFSEGSFSLSWMNRLTWRDVGDSSIFLQHISRGSMKLVVPWWFPLPDAVVRATFQATIRYMISDGQSKISKAVQKRYAELQSA
ncbi:unnamed protein product [Effrenium voratum]|nr:unnamed protein product [Effrenium voratum]